MRHLCALIGCLLMLSFSSVQANSTTSNPSYLDPQTDALLQQLTEVKLAKTLPILQQLESTAGVSILPLFNTLLSGNLYYRKSDRQLFAAEKVSDGYQTRYPFTLDPAAVLPKKQLKKVRVNNKLRVYLRQAIARLQLQHIDAEVRLAAVKALLANLDEALIDQLRKQRSDEADADVRKMIDLALALHQAEQPSAQARLQALALLGESLQPEARNKVTQLAEFDNDAEVKAAASKKLTRLNEQVEFYGFIDQLFFGLSLGSVLLLAAIGLAITFGVMGVINMAHGEMIMLGAYTTYVVQLLMPQALEYSLWVAIPAAFVVAGLMGVLIERCVIRYLNGRPLETLLATFGISLILQQLVRTIFSPLNRQVASPEWMSGSLDINPLLSLTLNRLYILAFALLVFGVLLLILRNTSLGLNVRAVSQNRDMAKAMGIRTDRVDAMTFGLGSGIAGIAGVALSQLTNVGPNLGQAYIIDSFMVVVFGGVGNLLGTLVAAFSLGVANKFLEPMTGAVLASIFVLVFIILFIQKRPKGLFPQKGRAAE